MKKCISLIWVLTIALVVGCALATVTSVSVASEKYVIANLPKFVGGAWFNRMMVGLDTFSEETGHETFQTGPDRVDAALQVKEIEDLITQGVDIITVVPFSPDTLEPVLKRAMDDGIIVISHEAEGIENVHYNIEAFDNDAFAHHMMDRMAAVVGEKGEYAVAVSALTNRSHMMWSDALIKYQEEKYPNMTCINKDAYIEGGSDARQAAVIMTEMMKTHPNLVALFQTTATLVQGFSLGVEEAGMQGKVFVCGLGLPSTAGPYLRNGIAQAISFWDPADAGLAMAKVGVIVKEGGTPKTGDNLGVTGFENIEVTGNLIRGEAWIDLTLENLDAFGGF